MHTQQVISHQLTLQAIDAMSRACQVMKKPAVFAVVDRHGELLALLRLDEASLVSTSVAANKAYTAARLGRSTKDLGVAARDPVNGFELANFGDSRMTVWGGGLPILVGGDCVGGIGVSGLTMDEDEAVARIGLEAILAAGGRS